MLFQHHHTSFRRLKTQGNDASLPLFAFCCHSILHLCDIMSYDIGQFKCDMWQYNFFKHKNIWERERERERERDILMHLYVTIRLVNVSDTLDLMVHKGSPCHSLSYYYLLVWFEFILWGFRMIWIFLWNEVTTYIQTLHKTDHTCILVLRVCDIIFTILCWVFKMGDDERESVHNNPPSSLIL